MCRSGFYTYEHIQPLFKDAQNHDPDEICCLCGSCHLAVTLGRLSKESVKSAYLRIQNQNPTEIPPPIGPIDFNDGNANLKVGSITYYPAIHTVLRYHGIDLIKVTPAHSQGEPGAISAVFTNDLGQETLRLEENEWIGAIENWDIETTGSRITVRQKPGHVSLQIRLDPPGQLILEKLDMRFESAHVLATETTYAIGRYISDNLVQWMYADIAILGSDANGAAIEFTTPEELDRRCMESIGKGLSTESGDIAVIGGIGALLKTHGMCLGSHCNLILKEFALGPRNLTEMRAVISKHPHKLPQFIGTGKI